MCVHVSRPVCDVSRLYVSVRVAPPAAFNYAAACWTRWAAPSHTECLCRAWAPRPTCTGWTASLHHSRRRTCRDKSEVSAWMRARACARACAGSLPVVPYKLYVVALVALFDAVDTDGVPVRRVTGVTPGERATAGVSSHQTAPPTTEGRGGGAGTGTCRSHAWGNWCSWRSCRDTGLG